MYPPVYAPLDPINAFDRHPNVCMHYALLNVDADRFQKVLNIDADGFQKVRRDERHAGAPLLAPGRPSAMCAIGNAYIGIKVRTM